MSQATSPTHVNEKKFTFGPWIISARKSHILQSRCTNPSQCQSTKIDESGEHRKLLCDFCLYEKELDLPQLPEMTFASNGLMLKHEKGFGIEFNPLDALKMVDSKDDKMKVAVAEAWQESREENSKIKQVMKPFDWTYTTNYKGSLFGNADTYKVVQTDERIDMEKLKERSKILFYEDIILFEDELADNGTAQLSVKIRVMPDGFFVLQRYFLRIDHLFIRIIDTRIYLDAEKDILLRESTTKESKTKDLDESLVNSNNPQELWDHLPTVEFVNEKIEF